MLVTDIVVVVDGAVECRAEDFRCRHGVDPVDA